MPVDALLADAVELDPRAARRGAHVPGRVRFAVRVDPDERRRRDARLLEEVELLQGGAAVAGVRGDWQSRRLVRERRGAHQLRVDRGQRTGIDADLHERRLDARAVDPVLPLANPARRELLGALRERVRRQVLVLLAP